MACRPSAVVAVALAWVLTFGAGPPAVEAATTVNTGSANTGSANTGSVSTGSPTIAPGYMANELKGVSCPSSGTCVAVGYYDYDNGGTENTLVDTLASGTWTMTSSPDDGVNDNVLTAVSCPEPGWCAAVGYYDVAGTDHTLVEVLSNGTWSVVPSPDPTSSTNALEGVSCASVSSCVAVGYYDRSGKARAEP